MRKLLLIGVVCLLVSGCGITRDKMVDIVKGELKAYWDENGKFILDKGKEAALAAVEMQAQGKKEELEAMGITMADLDINGDGVVDYIEVAAGTSRFHSAFAQENEQREARGEKPMVWYEFILMIFAAMFVYNKGGKMAGGKLDALIAVLVPPKKKKRV